MGKEQIRETGNGSGNLWRLELLEPRVLLSVGPFHLTTAASTAATHITGVVVPDGGLNPMLAQSGPLIGMPAFRADPRFAGIDGRGYSVAVLDTGIDVNHPFFGPDANGDGIADRIVYQHDFVNNDNDASDDHGHGSNVSSIIGSQDGTLTGMAPGVNIIALKVLDASGSGTFGQLEQALQWVVASAAAYNIVSVNMSLGDGGNYNTPQALYGISDEMAALNAEGVIVCCADGNSFYNFGSAQGVAYPAADASSLAVGAVWDGNDGSNILWSTGAEDYTTAADRITSFSQRSGTMTGIFAPGAMITGANQNGGTVTYAGTSQATPHIAGIAALAQQLAVQDMGRRLTGTEFQNLLQSSGVSIVDGDDENDNVTNTGLTFQRIDMMALANAIEAMGNRPAEVDGQVWEDLDGNGAPDSGEPAISGVTVFADLNTNGVADPGEPATTSDTNGLYALMGLAHGTYTIRQSPLPGYVLSCPADGFYSLTLSPGQVATGMSFGNELQQPNQSARPNQPDLMDLSDTGASAVDNLTNLNNGTLGKALQFRIGGTVLGAALVLYADGVAIGSATAEDVSTLVTTNGSSVLAEGARAFTARQTEIGKSVSGVSTTCTVTIDTVAPGAPAAPDLQPGSDSGVSNTDNITNITTPTFNVSASPYFRFYRGATQIGGDYLSGTSFRLPLQPDGVNSYAVAREDAAGNVSPRGTALSVTVDTVAPAVPAAPDLQSGSDSGVSNSDNITHAAPLTFDASSTEAGVLHLSEDGAEATQAHVPGAGTYPLTLSKPTGFLPSITGFTGLTGYFSLSTDFNHDGRYDLLVSSGAAVLLSNGDGTFTPQNTTISTDWFTYVTAGDFNNDGNQDVATANVNSKIIAIYLGNGDGSFQSARTISTPNTCAQMAVADFNRDGKLDIVMSNFQMGNNVTLFLGNGDGTFMPESLIAAIGTPRQVITGDFNGDGKMDFVICDQSNKTLVVFNGNGNGTFMPGASYPVGAVPGLLTSGDFNNDGIPDLASSDYDDNTISILLNKGDGTFQPRRTISGFHYPMQIVAKDYNHDGNIDLAVCNENVMGPSVLYGKGDGTFQTAVTYAQPSYPLGMSVGDFNGDGYMDLATLIYSSGVVNVNLNAGSGGLADGVHTVTACSEDLAGNKSAASDSLSVTIDTSAPAASIVTTASDPTRTGLDSITIRFNEPVQGLDLADLQLRQGGGNLLTGAQTLSTSDNITWTLGNLSGLTATPGVYTLTLAGSGSGITDLAGNALAAGATQPITVYARGDVNMDGAVDGTDIDQIYANFGNHPAYDMTHDGVVNQADVDELVKNVLHARYGDANLDHKVDFADFQALRNNWMMIGMGWATGDFTGDHVPDFADFQKVLDNWSPAGYAGSSQTTVVLISADSLSASTSSEVATSAMSVSGNVHTTPVEQTSIGLVESTQESQSLPLSADGSIATPAPRADLKVAVPLGVETIQQPGGSCLTRKPMPHRGSSLAAWDTSDGQVDLLTQLVKPVTA